MWWPCSQADLHLALHVALLAGSLREALLPSELLIPFHLLSDTMDFGIAQNTDWFSDTQMSNASERWPGLWEVPMYVLEVS